MLYYLFSVILFRSCSFHGCQIKQSNEKQNKGTLFFVVSNQQNFVANETKRFQLRPKHKTEQNRTWKLFKRKWNHFCLSWMGSKTTESLEQHLSVNLNVNFWFEITTEHLRSNVYTVEQKFLIFKKLSISLGNVKHTFGSNESKIMVPITTFEQTKRNCKWKLLKESGIRFLRH